MTLPEKRAPLTDEQYRYFAACFSEWLRLKAAHEQRWQVVLHAPAATQIITKIDPDLWHSALLYRMAVEGKDPLPEPPPTRHSYPDYDAVDKAGRNPESSPARDDLNEV